MSIDEGGCALAQYEREQRIVELASPEGSAHERHKRLVELAKMMGFDEAEAGWWTYDPDREPIIDLKDAVDGCELQELTLGIYLHDTISVVEVYHEDEDRYELTVHNTLEEAQKRMSACVAHGGAGKEQQQ